MTEQRKEFINEKEPQLHGDSKWYRNHMKGRLAHAYMRTDGSFDWPNSLEGDLLRLTRQLLVVLDQEESEPAQPTFKVGEYYSFDDLGKREIFKVLSVSEGRMSVKSYKVQADMFSEFSSYTTGNSIAVTNSKPANTEEIALFKRAEHFHKHGRKLNEFKIGDLVMSEFPNDFAIVKKMDVSSLYASINNEFDYKNDCRIVMTAEELEAAAAEVRE